MSFRNQDEIVFSQLETFNNKITETVFRIADLHPLFSNFDPHSDFNNEIISLVYDSLITFDPITGKIVPNLVQNWFVTNDSTEWTFTLKNNVLFHDGFPVNSTAVKFSLDRFFNSSHPAFVADPSWDWLRIIPIQTFEILDNLKFKIILSQPYSPLLNDLAWIKIFSRNSIQIDSFTSPIGSGPYKIDVTTSTDSYIRFTRFNDHFRGLAPFDVIEYQTFFGRENQLESLIDSEQVELLSDVEFFAELLINNETSELNAPWNVIFQNNTIIQNYGIFNFQQNIFTDVRVREALNYIINDTAFIELEDLGKSFPSTSILPINSAFQEKKFSGFPLNIVRAEQLLDQAGYPKNNFGIRFNLDVIGENQPEINFICLAFESVGINCNNNDANISRLFAGDFDIFFVNMTSFLGIQDIYHSFHSAGDRNYGSFSSIEIDQLIQNTLETSVKRLRKGFINNIELVLQNLIPFILVSDSFRFEIIKSGFQDNISLNPINGIQFFSLFDQISVVEDLYTDIIVGDKPIYLEKENTLLLNPNSEIITFNIATGEDTTDIAKLRENSRLFDISVDNDNLPYQLRIYYDDPIIEDSKIEFDVFTYNEESNTWNAYADIWIHENDHYLQINLQGDIVFQAIENFITYYLVPFVWFITVFFSVTTVITMVRNQKLAKELRKLDQ